MFDSIDRNLFKFFTKITRDLNWITGKDNFFFARSSVVMYLIGAILAFPLLMVYLDFLNKTFFASFGAALLTISYVFIAQEDMKWISELESLIVNEQLLGAKFLEIDHLLKVCRRMTLFITTFIIPIFLAFLFLYGPVFSGGLIIFIIFKVAKDYFVSVEKPPFQKSQVLEKIRNWFLIPAPVKVGARS